MSGNDIKVLLARKNLTQRQLARELGISTVHLCNLLNGKSEISVPMLHRIAAAIGMQCKISFTA